VKALVTALSEHAWKVTDAVTTFTLDLHNEVCTENEYSCDNCRATHGASLNICKMAVKVRAFLSINVLTDMNKTFKAPSTHDITVKYILHSSLVLKLKKVTFFCLCVRHETHIS
jgi:hypothetical protein